MDRVMLRLSVGLALLVSVIGLAHAEPDWEPIGEKDGVRYEKRWVASTKIYEYRGTWFMPRPPAEVVELIWANIDSLRGKQVTEREVLRRTATELVTHDQVSTPVVSDRELTLRFEKHAQPPYSVRFVARNDLGPPPRPKNVVVPVVRGGWRIEPAPGGSEIAYDCYSEPGGSVPPWMVRGAQQDQIKQDIQMLRARLR